MYVRILELGFLMELRLPKQYFLSKSSDIDYFYWNYQFPIKYIQRYRFKSVLKLINSEYFDKLLEIGTGSGIFLPELSNHCRQLYAIDIHDKIESVQKFCKNQKIIANISKCSIESTNFPDNFFDAIISVSVLEFIADLSSAFNEIVRIIKPTGIFIAICPQKSFFLDFILSFLSDKSPDEEFVNSRHEIGPILEDFFKVMEKRVFPPLLGKLLPVYNCYKLRK